jgi:hypothetical protein
MRMFSRLSLLVFLCLIFAVSFTATANCTGVDNIQPQPQAAKQKMTQLIIKFRKADFDPAQGDYLQKLSRDIKATLVYLRPMSGGAHVFSLGNVSAATQLATIIQQLSARPEILYVEQDRIMQHQKVH